LTMPGKGKKLSPDTEIPSHCRAFMRAPPLPQHP
jgi:hypothetical protein